MSTRLRIYIHACGPAFRGRTRQEIRTLLKGTAPRQKLPKITMVGNTGLSCRVTLRDLYILAHGLRTADDILVQLVRPHLKVGSLNKLIQALQAIPIHAFAPRVMPFRAIRHQGKLTPAELKEEEYLRQEAESHLLHNNVRVLIDKSILSNREVVRKFASETFRSMLLLRRGQTMKRRNVKYTDNPVLFGKSEAEGAEILQLMAQQEQATQEEEVTADFDEQEVEVAEEDMERYTLELDEILDRDGEVDTLRLRAALNRMIREGRQRAAAQSVEKDSDGEDANSDAEVQAAAEELEQTLKRTSPLPSGATPASMAAELLEREAEAEAQDSEVELDDSSVLIIKAHIDDLRAQNALKDGQKTIELMLANPDARDGATEEQREALRELMQDQEEEGEREETDAETLEARYAELVNADEEEVKQLEDALLKISRNEVVKGAMEPSLLVPTLVHEGATGSASDTTPKAKAADSIPTVQSFLPHPYSKWSEGKIKRTARSQPELARMYENAKKKVSEISRRLKAKDKEVRTAVTEYKQYTPPPALYIPSRPVPELVHNALTLQLERNTLTVSLSAIGQQDRALYKRGWRTHIIETSMRETVAAGCLALAYEAMEPLKPDSPLAKLEEPEFTQPIRKAFQSLAANVRVSRSLHDDHDYLARQQQKVLLNTMTEMMGPEAAQVDLLSTLVDEHNDLLSKPKVLADMRGDPVDKKKHKNLLLGEHSIPRELRSGQIDLATALGVQPQQEQQADTQLITDGSASDAATATATATTTTTTMSATTGAAVTSTGSNTSASTSASASSPVSEGASSTKDKVGRADAPVSTRDIASFGKPAATVGEKRVKPAANDRTPDGKPTPSAIIDAITNLPVYHQAQAAASLAVGLPFDPIAPIPSPAVVQLRSVQPHARDSTQLSEVLAYTLANSMTESDPAIRVFDPFCGSGTLLIESVFRFMGLPTPPLPRAFAFENWPVHNEYEYNALMREWNRKYEEVVQEYVMQFGLSKTKSLFGEDMDEHDMTLENFPLFIGSDLRDKSVRAAVHNAKNARVNYFTQFYKSDFERIIRQAADKWAECEAENKHKQQQDDGFVPNNDFGSSSVFHRGSSALHGSTPAAPTAAPAAPAGLPAILTPDDIMRMQGFDIPQDKPQRHQKPRKQAPVPAPSALTRASELPLRFPYLKGYTLFANVPWGVSDEKPYLTGAQRRDRNDSYSRGHVNTTQHESMESVYQRLGATLYRFGHMFRDVFILSAHHKFEKMTAIGAQRAALMDESTPNQRTKAVMLRNQIAKLEVKGDLKWTKVTTFYNQGVKTDLLKLEK